MTALRILLAAIFIGMVVYTGLVIADHGMDFLTPFNSAVAAIDWQGQFNLDLISFLVLSAIWIGWRHGFAGAGLLLAAGPLLLGMIFVAGYTLVASFAAKDGRELLIGARRI